MSREHEKARTQRIEMILQEVESLPTLSPIATRLLQLSVDSDVEISRIVSLVEADPALTSKLLSMCRYRDRAASQQVTTVERAVVLLGIEAVRSALLSVHVFEMLGDSPGASLDDAPCDEPGLDRVELWRHLLATACAAEMLARENRPVLGKQSPEEAFTAGLLHDLGKIALEMLLPRTYGQIVRAAGQHSGSVAELERRLIGIDHHRAGKKLAQHWCLPHSLLDVIWLHNQPYGTLPDLPHKGMIAIVSVADAIVRKLHIGWSGSSVADLSLEALANSYGVSSSSVARVEGSLHAAVAKRAEELGLDDVVGTELQMRSIAAANQSLSSLNEALQKQAHRCSEQGVALHAINVFLEDASHSRSMIDSIGAVVRSVSALLGGGTCCSLYQRREHSPWEICQFGGNGKLSQSECIDPPCDLGTIEVMRDLRDIQSGIRTGAPHFEEWLGRSDAAPSCRLISLTLAGRSPVLLVHQPAENDATQHGAVVGALRKVWSTSLASAAQHEGACRMGDELAEANRVLSETQSDLAEARSLMKLSTLAAGAAHEMNNPLTIISGRCQVLRRKLKDKETLASIEAIHEASCRLSDLISALHVFASPPMPERKSVDLSDLLMRTVRDLKLERHTRHMACPPVQVVFEDRVPPVRVDPEQVAAATKELLKNAMESETDEIIRVRVHMPEDDDRLTITVEDTGKGIRPEVLEKAFDPFFSEKKAGRQPGLGLAVARRLIELHGGTISLDSEDGAGTRARIVLPGVRKRADKTYVPIEQDGTQAA